MILQILKASQFWPFRISLEEATRGIVKV
jgi:hypothetical protein